MCDIPSMRCHQAIEMKTILALIPCFVFLLASPVVAQSVPTSQNEKAAEGGKIDENDLNTVVRLFHDRLLKGCMEANPKVENHSAYCTCYASLFMKRYTPQELVNIIILGNEVPQSARFVTVMMGPERRACLSANP